MVSSKHAFWQALIFTIIVFGIGMLLGFFLENSRANSVESNLMNSEINLVDEQARNSAMENINISCNESIKSTFDFADRIYREAQQLEEYDAVSKFTSSLTILHKRYDLLRMMLWLESINVKKRCGNKFHTVVYMYDYNVGDINEKALQDSMSHLLTDLKNKYPDKVLLIPMAVNLNLDSISMAADSYKIGDFPAIVIDENRTLIGLINSNQLENAVFQSRI